MSLLRDILITTMEGNIQPSFIPKKPLMARPLTPAPQKPARTINFFTLIIMVIFLTTLIITGVVYGYNFFLARQKTNLQAELKSELEKINKAEVAELSRVSTRLESSKFLLNQHLALSEFFDFLSRSTLQNVRFSSFTYKVQGQNIDISMGGQAKNFTSVALQSAEFLKAENRALIENPQFTNLNLSETGDVVFNFTGRLKPNQLLYKNILSAQANGFDAQPAVEEDSDTDTASSSEETN
jgi:hypothetical protein